MEKEQIIKALEVCSNYQGFGDCDKCPASEGCDTEWNFLEREALSLILEQEKRIEEVKAETVRKMQEGIKERCVKVDIYPAFFANTIAKVAKELLEDVIHP